MFGRVPALNTPDVRGHVRPAAVDGVDPADEVGPGEDRAAALLGLDARVGGTAEDADPQIGDALPL